MSKIVISACIPCMNRTYDLKKTMPSIIKAANKSFPVEILVLDYNSQDDLEEYIDEVMRVEPLEMGNKISYYKYRKGSYFRLAHAYNLSIKLSIGKYFVLLGTDTILTSDFFGAVRKLLEKDDYVWMYNKYYGGIIVCEKREFIDAGGYDERFEMYGPEDKELELRLRRRGGKMGHLPSGLLTMIETPKSEKFKNYPPNKLAKRKKNMRAVYKENMKNNVLVVNKGEDWGKWE